MKEAFRGWGRKLGCATLVLSCVFAAGWVRSCSTIDLLYLRGLTQGSQWMVLSGGQKFYVMPADDVETHISRGLNGEEAKLILLGRPFTLELGYYFHHSVPVARVLGIFRNRDDPHPQASMVPYWTVVVPLILLSAWLLLSKPRQLNQKRIHEPTAIEGT